MEKARKIFATARFAGLHALWWIAAGLSLVLSLYSHVLGIGAYDNPCSPDACSLFMMNAKQLADLGGIGISPELYGGLSVILLALQNLSSWSVGLLLYYYGRKDSTCVVASFMLIVTGTIFSTDDFLFASSHSWAFLSELFILLNIVGATYLFFLFLLPEGRFAPKWTAIPASIWLLEILIGILPLPAFFRFINVLYLPPVLMIIYITVMHGLVIYVQIHRYRHRANTEQKRQIRWFWAAMGCYIMAGMLSSLETGDTNGILKIFNLIVLYSGLLFLPFSIGVIVLENRIRRVSATFNRTIVYVVLSAMSVAAYALLIGVFGVLLQGKVPAMVSLLATGLVAVMFQPLRYKVQKAVNHLVFGERDEPYKMLSDLSDRLEDAIATSSLFPAIAETAARALRSPYTAIEMHGENGYIRTLASVGQPDESRLSLIPLAVRGEPVGQLILGIEHVGEALPPGQRQMLDDLVRQISIAVQTLRLTDELQRSREKLITAREEERRRLRRDLHDGLGSALASMMLRLDEALSHQSGLPDASRKPLETVQSLMREAITDIRRLVYSLRPPALDEFGLSFALEELVSHYRDPSLYVSFEGTAREIALTAATEVAVYRIVQEALTNVVKHANATHCKVSLSTLDGILLLEIADNGSGLPENLVPGVGIRSIRERAEELGGECDFHSIWEVGVRITIRLPIEEGRS